MTPSHMLKAFLNLLYLGSVDLDLQSLPGFLNLIQLLNVEANIETPPAEFNVQTSLTEKPEALASFGSTLAISFNRPEFLEHGTWRTVEKGSPCTALWIGWLPLHTPDSLDLHS